MAQQAPVPPSVPLTSAAFGPACGTTLYLLSSAGIFVNSRGTTLLIDPVLVCHEKDGELRSESWDLPLYERPPLAPTDIPSVDAVLFTHADHDHMGPETIQALSKKGTMFHVPIYVRSVLLELGVPVEQIETHFVGEIFSVGDLRITVTRAVHAWQLFSTDFDDYYGENDCCGFVVDTADGSFWNPGDTRLLEEHLTRPPVDLLFIDFCKDRGHLGFNAAVELANAQADADLIAFHYGTFAVDENCYNANPEEARPHLTRPERLHCPAFGEPITLVRRTKR